MAGDRKFYMQKGSTYIEQQVNYISGNQIIGRTEDAETEEKSEQHPPMDEKEDLPYNSLERALMVVGEMVMDGTIADKKEHAALCQIIKERIDKDLTTVDYCVLLASYTLLPDSKRPVNEDIRKVSFSGKHLFPDWKIASFSATRTLRYVSLAREFLRRERTLYSKS